MIPPPNQNTVAVCNQITILILDYIISRMVTLFKVFDAPMQVSAILGIIFVSKFMNFSFQIFLFMSLKCLLASHLTMFRVSLLLWVGSRYNCILSCFFSSKIVNIINQTLFYAASIHRARPSLAEVLIFSLMFFHF